MRKPMRYGFVIAALAGIISLSACSINVDNVDIKGIGSVSENAEAEESSEPAESALNADSAEKSDPQLPAGDDPQLLSGNESDIAKNTAIEEEDIAIVPETEETNNKLDGYTLEQVVILSRHNLRAPLSSSGSVPQELTPHEWIKWSAPASELTVKGGLLETNMGQYFSEWLDEEGLISENSIPAPGEVRFNARDKQRCRATARFFASGLFPLADITVEYPGDTNNTKDFMKPAIHFYSDEYAEEVNEQVAELGGDDGFEGISEETRDAIALIMDTVDMKDSEAYKSGKYGDLLKDPTGYTMSPEEEPDITGAVKTANQVADALILQYYEEQDDKAAAFGHDLSRNDWETIGSFMTTALKIRHGAPLAAVNITKPLLEELEGELKNEDRKLSFFCAHDCTVLGTLSALGAEPYSLPGSIETMTPIGVKLMFERFRSEDDSIWYRVNLLYRSADQIRNADILSLDNPPLRYAVEFEGIETNEDGLISQEDLFELFDDSIESYYELEEEYAMDKAA
ncbi:MAG: hypothetical protein J6O55_04335 [Lachnospiraceae bacterium]|nr:hypothetical protein [Lachnospiraceae bacterium]